MPTSRHELAYAILKAIVAPARDGKRSIHWMGHVKTMAAVQPFLSDAISRTVNVPTDATVEEIQQAYVEGWRPGLKVIAVYRDGCKRAQPLSTAQRLLLPLRQLRLDERV